MRQERRSARDDLIDIHMRLEVIEKKINQLLDSGTEVVVELLHEMDLLLVCQDELSRFVADIDRHKGHTWCSFVFTEIPSSQAPQSLTGEVDLCSRRFQAPQLCVHGDSKLPKA